MRVHQRLNAVLDREHAEQRGVDQQRHGERGLARGVDGLRHPEVADEADRVKEGCEEEGVARYAVEEDEPTFHGGYPVQKRPYWH